MQKGEVVRNGSGFLGTESPGRGEEEEKYRSKTENLASAFEADMPFLSP